MIEVNEGDINLDSLAGYAVDYTKGHELPQTLYIYGLTNNRDFDFYIDEKLEFAQQICEFLQMNGVSCTVGHPNNPHQRPAIGIRKEVRVNSIKFATKVCVFVLFVMHGVVDVPFSGGEFG